MLDEAFNHFLRNRAYKLYKKGTVGSWVTRNTKGELSNKFKHKKLIDSGYTHTDQGYLAPITRSDTEKVVAEILGREGSPQYMATTYSKCLFLDSESFDKLLQTFVDPATQEATMNLMVLEYGPGDSYLIIKH